MGDLSRIDYGKLPKDIDLIVGGTPCQDFSVSGLGKGGEEGSGTRSSLMWYYVKLIAQTKPKIVVWENVAAVLNCKHSLFGRQTIEDAVYRQYLVRLFEFGVFNSSHGHNVVRGKELPVIRRHVLVRFGKVFIGDIVGQFVSYAHARIVPARIGKANVRILPDCYDEYADTVLRQIEIFCVQHARVYLISEIAQRIVEFTVRHVNWIVDDRIPREKPIRHLIPQESLRFMGFENKDFYKCRYRYEKKGPKKIRRDNVPDGEIYIQAGNSIAVNVLMALFGQIYDVPWQDKVFKERKKTEEELLRELPLFAYMRDNAA